MGVTLLINKRKQLLLVTVIVAAGSFNYKRLFTEILIHLPNLIYYIISIILVYMWKSNMCYVRWYIELRWIKYISIVPSIMIYGSYLVFAENIS